jgi:murein DD-endopeptidase MepM/ murein hydrolase activator NlpD
MTSGAHLHFELYKDRASIDPLRFLDTARLNFDDLPVKYRYKYIEDLKLKY